MRVRGVGVRVRVRGGILLFGCTGRGWSGGRRQGHTQEQTQERTRKCCTYPLATYPLKSARINQTPPSYGFGRYGFGFFRPRIAFRATDALWGCATPFFYHFSVHLSIVLGRTELCHEVWTPGPQKPQIISNENHHLALLELIR